MKCPNCNGTGKEYWNGHVFCNEGFECSKCHGTGKITQTNNEWLSSLSIVGKAIFLDLISPYGDAHYWINWLTAVRKDE